VPARQVGAKCARLFCRDPSPAGFIFVRLRRLRSYVRTMADDIPPHEELLKRSLEKLHTQQQELAASSSAQPTDRSDGRADLEPSAREAGDLPASNTFSARSVLPSLDRRGREGYGFRAQSGASTPAQPASLASPLPHEHGLGWPGKQSPRHPRIASMTNPVTPLVVVACSQVHGLPTECNTR
jgi:hypothetical protein